MSILKIEPQIANSSANFQFGNVFAANYYYANGALAGGGSVKYTADATPPISNNNPGDQWFNTSTQILYEYINDGTSEYWVDIASPTISSTNTPALQNGNSNVVIASSGNLSVSVSGTPNVLVTSTNSTTVTGGLIASNGLYSTSSYSGTFTDGIVVDYVTGTGRISVGSNDGISFYKNGVAGSSLMNIDTNGNTTIPGSTTTANGFYSTSSYAGTFTDGIVVDYVTGIGRISVGTADGISFYKNGVGSSQIFSIDANGNATIPGSLTVAGSMLFTGSTTIQLTSEIYSTKSGSTGIVVHDLTTGGTFYHVNPVSNFTINFTNVPATDMRITVASVIISQGSSAYVPTAVQIEGVAQTVKWLYGVAASGNASKTDMISYNLQRVGSSWVVYAQSAYYG